PDRSQSTVATATDADGRCSLAKMPRDACIGMRITSPGYVEQTLYAATTDQPQPDLIGRSISSTTMTTRLEPVLTGMLAITLQRGHRLRGQVVLAHTCQPVAEAIMALWGQE